MQKLWGEAERLVLCRRPDYMIIMVISGHKTYEFLNCPYEKLFHATRLQLKWFTWTSSDSWEVKPHIVSCRHRNCKPKGLNYCILRKVISEKCAPSMEKKKYQNATWNEPPVRTENCLVATCSHDSGIWIMPPAVQEGKKLLRALLLSLVKAISKSHALWLMWPCMLESDTPANPESVCISSVHQFVLFLCLASAIG